MARRVVLAVVLVLTNLVTGMIESYNASLLYFVPNINQAFLSCSYSNCHLGTIDINLNYQLLKRFDDVDDEIISLSVSDGDVAAISTLQARKLIILNMATGDFQQVIFTEVYVREIAFRTASDLFTISSDNKVHLYTLQSQLYVEKRFENSVTAGQGLAFIENEKVDSFLVAGDSLSMQIINITSFEVVDVVPLESKILTVSSSSYAPFFVTGHDNGDIKIWNASDWFLIQTLQIYKVISTPAVVFMHNLIFSLNRESTGSFSVCKTEFYSSENRWTVKNKQELELDFIPNRLSISDRTTFIGISGDNSSIITTCHMLDACSSTSTQTTTSSSTISTTIPETQSTTSTIKPDVSKPVATYFGIASAFFVFVV